MRNKHEEMLPSGAFNSRGSVIGGRSMRLHGGSDMGNWQQPWDNPGGSSIGGTDGQNSAPPYWPGGSTIGGESELGNQAIPAPNPWGLPGPSNGWIDDYNNSASPAPAPAPVTPVAPTPVAPSTPTAGGGAAGGGIAGGGSVVAINPAYRGVTLNTDATKSSVWNPAQPYYATTSPVQSQYAWAPRSEATPLQGGIPSWGIQQPTRAFDVDTFIRGLLSPSAQQATTVLPTPYPK